MVNNFVMASFDVESLFTNVPVIESCNIVLDKFFPNAQSTYLGFTKSLFEKTLKICTENVFLFNGKIYEQIEGYPMENNISPIMANIFLSHHEQQWLRDCPDQFKPVFYRRYVDDTFLLFRETSHVDLFQQYLNQQNPRIKFTCEMEKDDSLAFLDCKITKNADGFQSSSYRKPTFSGLGMKFDSAICHKYKLNLIDCLIDRAYKINSTVTSFCIELQRQTRYFTGNGYNIFTLERQFTKKLHRIKNPEPELITVSKKTIYCKIPYISKLDNMTLKKAMNEIVDTFFPHINLRLIFSNNFSIARMFPFKDRVPKRLQSRVVYKYCCGICNSTYIAETTRHYTTRISEHRGISPLTGAPMARVNSHIYNHFLETEHPIKEDYFSILFITSPSDVQLSESIAIDKLNQDLNDRQSSTPLSLLT